MSIIRLTCSAICTILLLFSQQAFSQAIETKNTVVTPHARWTFTTAKVSDTEFDLVCIANIEDGWYVYSSNIGSDGPIPTSITIESPNVQVVDGIKEVSEHKHEGMDEMFGMYIVKYTKQVSYIQRFKVIDASKPVKGFLTFMTCDNSQCLPPRDLQFHLMPNI